MSDEEIEREWRIGHSLNWLTVENVIFNYQTAVLRGEKSWT